LTLIKGFFVASDSISVLSSSELRYRRLFETAQDGILIIDFSSGKIEDANPFLLDLLGYTKDEIIGKALWEIGAIVDKAAAIAAFDVLKEKAYIRYEDLPLKPKHGGIINVEFVSNAYDVGNTRVIQCNIRDISARKKIEAELIFSRAESDKSNWAVLAYAHAAMALARSDSPEDLIQNVCEAIVQQALFVVTWVGMTEPDRDKTVRVAGIAGTAKAYAQGIDVSWALESPNGLGPTGQCIRTGKTVLISDTLTDPNFAPWRERANQYGIRCSVAVPIPDGGVADGALMVYAQIPNAFSQNEIYLFENLAEEIGYGLHAIQRRQQLAEEMKARESIQKQLYQALESTIEAMSKTMEWRDSYTAGHQRRVAQIATAIGREMGLDEERLKGIHLGCLVHDMGKVAIPSEILTKPSKLTDLEMQMVRQHVQTSYDILKDIPFFWPIAEMVYQHHERLDGSGYPRGLKAEQIILEARILAVADTIEAMAAHRPYRAALGLDAALKVIQDGRATLFDDEVVSTCLRLFNEKHYQLPAL
jgi:PAS domain S-box-containing protein